MASNDSVIIISSDSDCESDIRSGSLTPEHIVAESGHVIMPVADRQVNCYNYLLDVMQARYNEAIKCHNYNGERYTFQDFCKTVKMIGLDKKHEVNYLTNQDRLIHNHVFKIMLETITFETASCDTYSAVRKLFLVCYKADEIMSGGLF